MRKIYSFLLVTLVLCGVVNAQSPITMHTTSIYNAAFDQSLSDSAQKVQPYYSDLGVRKVIVADAKGDGKQEIIATDYSNGGRVHVIAPSESDPSVLEVIWSSPVVAGASGSSPRCPQVGDCDGDGLPEIIFSRGGDGKLVFYEWNPDAKTWGSDPSGAPDFFINTASYKAAGAIEDLRLTRETLLVKDLDGDGKSEIITAGSNPGRDVYVLGVDGDIPASFGTKIVLEGGDPAKVPTNGHSWATGSFYSVAAGDINGDGKLEIVNHHYNNFGFWNIVVNGPDSYTYPDFNSPYKDSIYAQYTPGVDDYSILGIITADVDGDKKDEVFATKYAGNTGVEVMTFSKADTGVYIWKTDAATIARRNGRIATKDELAKMGGKKAAQFMALSKGDLNKDGKDEVYTGGGAGVNLFAIQYKGTGALNDPNSYVKNLVYSGTGNDVFHQFDIYHGVVDTIISATDTTYTLDQTKIDTVHIDPPFTASIFADHVDLNKDGKMEIVLSEQNVFKTNVIHEYVWVDSTHQWKQDTLKTKEVFNPYRKTIRVLEQTGTSGLKDQNYSLVYPEDYKLEQNYPNPFNPTTNIRFTLPLDKKISLKVYDMLGKEVASLVNDQLYKKGKYEVMWNGMTNSGQNAASGNYIARLIFGNYSQSIKMTLLK
ncbi:MAG: FG-GAP-like repeat-containing protein [Syntrophomonadaceae bacterium]